MFAFYIYCYYCADMYSAATLVVLVAEPLLKLRDVYSDMWLPFPWLGSWNSLDGDRRLAMVAWTWLLLLFVSIPNILCLFNMWCSAVRVALQYIWLTNHTHASQCLWLAGIHARVSSNNFEENIYACAHLFINHSRSWLQVSYGKLMAVTSPSKLWVVLVVSQFSVLEIKLL